MEPDLEQSLELARRAQEGERNALESLFARYQDRLRRVVRVRLGVRLRGEMESMDVVQDTFAVALRKLPTLEVRSRAGLLAWLSKIAENQIRDAHDRGAAQKRDRGREVALDPGATAGHDPAASETLPDERVARREAIEVVDAALTELTQDHREVILQRDYLGADWSEVAGALGRSVPAAQELHRRAWIRLRRIVRPRLEAGED